ncbi:MAG: glycosyltransferase [bacterium]|nr:glycosyltransferase [bacterium]
MQVERALVSVIVPVYNGERYLGSALQSIFEQDYHPFEVIVVDDGSVDGSADVAKSFDGIRYMYQTNQGNAAAMNAGIEAASGEFIAFLDADDLWAPNKLSAGVDYLLEHLEIGFVIARMQNFLEPGARRPPRLTRDLSLTNYVALSVGTLVTRKTVFEQIGNFDTTHSYAKDVDWFIRAKEAGIRMEVLPETLLYRRLHGSNRSYQTEARTSDLLRVIKSGIDRKRAQASAR